MLMCFSFEEQNKYTRYDALIDIAERWKLCAIFCIATREFALIAGSNIISATRYRTTVHCDTWGLSTNAEEMYERVYIR